MVVETHKFSAVIKHAQNKKWTEIAEALLKDAQSLISAGKNAVKNQEAQTDFNSVVQRTISNIKEMLRLSKQDMQKGESPGPSDRTSARLSMANSPATPLQMQALRNNDDLPSSLRPLANALPQFRQVWENASSEQQRTVLELLANGGASSSLQQAFAASRDSPERSSVHRLSSVVSVVPGKEELAAEAHLADVEQSYKTTLRDMQRWYNMLRSPFRFWAPNFDKTDYEAIIDRATEEGKVIASMVEPIDEIAGRTFLLIVNANLCVGESSSPSPDSEFLADPTQSRMQLVEQPARALFEQLLTLVKALRLANAGKKDGANMVNASIAECSKWLEGETPVFLGEEDEVHSKKCGLPFLV